ncbi:MAG: ISNCY family transposase, partial [Bacteroidota bacterium]
ESKHSSDKVIEAITAIAPSKQQDIMTALQQLEQRSEQKGRQEGIQQGMQQGRQEGIQQGMQQGRQEGIEKRNIEIARNMLSSNESKEKIHQFTGLSWAEIEALIQEQKTDKK